MVNSEETISVKQDTRVGHRCRMIPTFVYVRMLNIEFHVSTGSVPDGKYDRNTKIYYCCRTDGTQSMKLTLPTEKPFYLLKYGSRCQEVGSKICSHQLAS